MNKKKVWAVKDEKPVGVHMERFGKISVSDLVCLKGLQDAYEAHMAAYGAFMESIGARYVIPADREWVIMPNGDVAMKVTKQ